MASLVRVSKIGLLAVAAFCCSPFTAGAQTYGQSAERETGRKVRVVLPSPYQQTEIQPSTSANDSTPPIGAKSAVSSAQSPYLTEPGLTPSVRTSTFLTAPETGSRFEKPSNEVEASTKRAAAEHDLNVASLSELNSLEGGGMIGRAIIAGRPYHSTGELLTRRILSRPTYERIKAQIAVRPSGAY